MGQVGSGREFFTSRGSGRVGSVQEVFTSHGLGPVRSGPVRSGQEASTISRVESGETDPTQPVKLI